MLPPFKLENLQLPRAVRRTALTVVLGFVSFGTVSSFAQDADVSGAVPGYARGLPVSLDSVQMLGASPLLVSPSDAADAWQMTTDANGSPATAANFASFNARATESIPGIQTVPLFEGAFAATGGPRQNTIFPYIMMGNSPLVGHTTVIPAKITTVSVQLLNADGTVFKTVSYVPFEHLTAESPNFEPFPYVSGRTQFVDAEQRATFWNTMRDEWHTILDPRVVNRVTITVPFFVNIQQADGSVIQARSYFTGTAADGSTFVLMLNRLFNVLFQNQVVSDINAGNDTTDAFNLQLWPNTYLFSLNASNPDVPGGCCVLGFHTFFANKAVPQSRWITAYASWISPGIFRGGLQDVTALSHEISEAFDDPFGNTAVPVWQFPGQPANSTMCQSNLETGDPVEVLPTATIAIPIKERGTNFTFHPQNEALLQWFNQGSTSNALNGAFSFPDATVLPHSAVPCPQ
jgi:hypothetical protein